MLGKAIGDPGLAVHSFGARLALHVGPTKLAPPEREGVIEMDAGGQAAQGGTANTVSVACGMFEGILAVLYEQAEGAGHLTASFVTAATLAADGRDALFTAPALDQALPPAASLPLLPADASLEGIADALAAYARQLATDLRQAAAQTASQRDRDALDSAARSAEAVCSCLDRASECPRE
jgi:hypothetical protein